VVQRPTTMGLKAAEILAHPAFKTVEWDLPPTRSGKAEVAKGRAGGPFQLHWEVHGTGDVKLVVSRGTFRFFFAVDTYNMRQTRGAPWSRTDGMSRAGKSHRV
jgi:hypothetical protein